MMIYEFMNPENGTKVAFDEAIHILRRKILVYPDILPRDTLPKDILPKDILPKDIFPNGHFAERTFSRTDILPNGQFAERTTCRK